MGKVIAERLVSLNAHVFAIGRDIDNLPSTIGPNLTKVLVDVGEWDSAYNKVLVLGPVHGLVNNAGIAHIQSFLETTKQGWDEYEHLSFISTPEIMSLD